MAAQGSFDRALLHAPDDLDVITFVSASYFGQGRRKEDYELPTGLADDFLPAELQLAEEFLDLDTPRRYLSRDLAMLIYAYGRIGRTTDAQRLFVKFQGLDHPEPPARASTRRSSWSCADEWATATDATTADRRLCDLSLQRCKRLGRRNITRANRAKPNSVSMGGSGTATTVVSK